jgi:hypothetical protein
LNGDQELNQTTGFVMRALFRGMFLFLSVILAGCASTTRIGSPDDANRMIGSGSALLVLRTGEQLDVRSIHCEADSLSFVDGETDSACRMAIHEIQSVHVRHYGAGAIEGFLFGAIGGGAVGWLAGIGLPSSGEENLGKGLLAAGGIVCGGLGGLVVGAVSGHDHTYEMPEDSLSSEESRHDAEDSNQRGQ